MDDAVVSGLWLCYVTRYGAKNAVTAKEQGLRWFDFTYPWSTVDIVVLL